MKYVLVHFWRFLGNVPLLWYLKTFSQFNWRQFVIWRLCISCLPLAKPNNWILLASYCAGHMYTVLCSKCQLTGSQLNFIIQNLNWELTKEQKTVEHCTCRSENVCSVHNGFSLAAWYIGKDFFGSDELRTYSICGIALYLSYLTCS